MKKLSHLCFVLLTFSLLVSCGKDDTTPQPDPEAQFESISPTTPAPGDEIVIKGKYFGTDASKIKLQLDHTDMTITSLSDTELRFVIPGDILANSLGQRDYSRTLNCHLLKLTGASWSDIFNKNIVIQLREPKGWFSQAEIVSNKLSCFTATSDSVLWMLNTNSACVILKSTDKGNTWNTITPPSGYTFDAYWGNSPAYFVDDKTGWIANQNSITGKGMYFTVSYATDGKTFNKADISADPAFEIISGASASIIVSLWAKNYNTGLMMRSKGTLFGFMNGFTDGHWALMYENSNLNMLALSAIAMEEFSMIGKEKSGTNKTYLIHKKSSGIPTEYDIDTYVKSAGNLQHMSDGTVYINDVDTRNFYHITWPFNVTKLNRKADVFRFISSTVAYAVEGGTIYKTTNGGQTWSNEYMVDAPFTQPIGITEYNGHVWALMKDASTKNHKIIKYNP